MTADSASMYTDHKTSPLAGEGRKPGAQPPAEADSAPRPCRWCGSAMINPRRNQVCCSAQCREQLERSQRQRRKQAKVGAPKATCLWCDGPFERAHKHQEFCCPDHQQAFNNFWKGKGPSLAKALHAWRVGKVKGGLTDLCREFSIAREELKDKRGKAGAGKKGGK
jgi:hypothetical protein